MNGNVDDGSWSTFQVHSFGSFVGYFQSDVNTFVKCYSHSYFHLFGIFSRVFHFIWLIDSLVVIILVTASSVILPLTTTYWLSFVIG